MVSQGTVRSWNFADDGGVIDSVDTPGGCRATFSDLLVEGISVTDEDGSASIGLPAGEAVDFEWTPAVDDEEFDYHAVAVWPSRCDPPAQIRRGAFRTSLWFVADGDGDDEVRIARQADPASLPPTGIRGTCVHTRQL